VKVARSAHRHEQGQPNLAEPLWFRICQFRLPSCPALALVQRRVSLWRLDVMIFQFLAAHAALYSVPTEGEVVLRMTSRYRGPAQLIGLGGAMGSQVLMVALQLAGVEQSVACGSGCIVLALTFPPMFYFLYKADKERKKQDEEGAASATAEWEQGEAFRTAESEAPVRLIGGSLQVGSKLDVGPNAKSTASGRAGKPSVLIRPA
jgi:hypothetical protein